MRRRDQMRKSGERGARRKAMARWATAAKAALETAWIQKRARRWCSGRQPGRSVGEGDAWSFRDDIAQRQIGRESSRSVIVIDRPLSGNRPARTASRSIRWRHVKDRPACRLRQKGRPVVA